MLGDCHLVGGGISANDLKLVGVDIPSPGSMADFLLPTFRILFVDSIIITYTIAIIYWKS